MTALRILGGLFAVALLVSALVRYRRRRITRLNLIISTGLALVVGVLAVVPGLFDPLFDLFNFRRGGGRRLLAVLLFGNVVLLLLILRNQSETDVTRRDFQLLMEWMGTHSLPDEEVEGLPAGDRVVVVLPAHNEQANVGAVLAAMPEKVDGHPIVPLVVDDASEDRTAGVAREAGALVARLPIRRGGGQAVRVGYELGLRLDAIVVASIDADGQHDPAELPRLVEPILRDEYDMVQGSRILGSFERESRVRHLGVLFLSRLVSLMTGTRITDVSNGYRAIRSSTLRDLILREDQFWTSEVIIEALRQRARILEVPITVRARASGETKKPPAFKYGWQFLKVIVKTWLR
ncbi:MAG TPA: glycosyltransferase family 2 protein [Actinomycetota bacterium]|nr:glycosyltransferase family 2 protein [Actinomycetota bacterium]